MFGRTKISLRQRADRSQIPAFENKAPRRAIPKKTEVGVNMKIHMLMRCVACAGLMTIAITAGAQERASHASPRAFAYDANREVVVQGTVLEYSENSTLSPIGTHVTVQTSTGTVDVHLGPSSYLRDNYFSLSSGDSVRFVGAMISIGKSNVLLARIAQKGSQAIAIRSTQGFLLAPGATRSLSEEQRAQASQKVSAR